jgi:hypothetical protein
MKHILLPLLLLFAACSAPEPTPLTSNKKMQSQIDSLKWAVNILANAAIDQRVKDSVRFYQLEQEQTFQYKDIDSTKKAVRSVALLALKNDSANRAGLNRAVKRTAVTMEVLSWIPWLSPFIKKQR